MHHELEIYEHEPVEEPSDGMAICPACGGMRSESVGQGDQFEEAACWLCEGHGELDAEFVEQYRDRMKRKRAERNMLDEMQQLQNHEWVRKYKPEWLRQTTRRTTA